ncbi:MAG: hypothetical protein ACFNPW_00625 [Candidatus Nanosyncoccus sp.]
MRKRDKSTVASFPTLNPEVLAKVYRNINEFYAVDKKAWLAQHPDDAKLESLVKSGNFPNSMPKNSLKLRPSSKLLRNQKILKVIGLHTNLAMKMNLLKPLKVLVGVLPIPILHIIIFLMAITPAMTMIGKKMMKTGKMKKRREKIMIGKKMKIIQKKITKIALKPNSLSLN